MKLVPKRKKAAEGEDRGPGKRAKKEPSAPLGLVVCWGCCGVHGRCVQVVVGLASKQKI